MTFPSHPGKKFLFASRLYICLILLLLTTHALASKATSISHDKHIMRKLQDADKPAAKTEEPKKEEPKKEEPKKEEAPAGKPSGESEVKDVDATTPKCASFEYFNKKLTLAEFKTLRETKYCSAVAHECCDDTMLMKLAKWWQGTNTINNSDFSRAEIRKQKLTAIAYFTSHFLKEHKNFRKWAES